MINPTTNYVKSFLPTASGLGKSVSFAKEFKAICNVSCLVIIIGVITVLHLLKRLKS